MLDLDRYLDQQRSDGVQCSEGAFSLSAQKALEKYAKYQFEIPGLWLVKIVQCGVASDAEKIKISLSRQTLQITLPVSIGLTAEELWEAVISGHNLTPAQEHLVTGIRALYGQHEDLAWVCTAPNQTTLLSMRSGRLEQRELDISSGRNEFQLIVERNNSGVGLGKWLKTSVDELYAVRRLCWLSPVPIELDGRPLQNGTDPGMQTVARWEVGRGSEQNLRVFRDPGKAYRISDTQSVSYFAVSPQKFAPHFQRWCGTDRGFATAGALITMEVQDALESRIRYVYHGAIVEGPKFHVSLRDGLALRVYVPVGQLKVDLSQFRTAVRLSHTLDQLIRKEALVMLQEFFGHLEGTLGKKTSAEPQVKGAGATMATAATFIKTKALFLGLGLPAGLLVGGGVATALKMRDYNRRLARIDLKNACLAGIRQLKNYR